uniref:Serine hydroxymethyltransferase-like domain-containing protein n=1 Tax=Timema poppense TaxID=170557 RepID=A0A7R9HCZ2_TIMPO|nr:unnamed protein product [Timema poppensis]
MLAPRTISCDLGKEQFFDLKINIKVCFVAIDIMSGEMHHHLNDNLWDSDPFLYDLIKKERERQSSGLEMIASENFTSVPVLQCLSSCLHNKYSEGLPGQR